MSEYHDVRICNCGTCKQAIDLVLADVQNSIGPENVKEHCLHWFMTRAVAYGSVAAVLYKMAEKKLLVTSSTAEAYDMTTDVLTEDENVEYVIEQIRAIWGAALAKQAGEKLQ